MDLSKAFDCLPHDLLLLKLKSYGVVPSPLNLLESYLNNRKQCVKVGTNSSNWQTMFKGVPQRYILGSILFNIFLNDIFYFIHNSELYNYADDNTLSYADTNINKLIKTLEEESKILINWFSINKMKANPENVQAMQ
jgi:retron-type reverse transcriptase